MAKMLWLIHLILLLDWNVANTSPTAALNDKLQLSCPCVTVPLIPF